MALSRGIAAYICVVPNGKLSSGQRAKHLQRSNEAVARVDLRASHVPWSDMFTCDIADIVKALDSCIGRQLPESVRLFALWRLCGVHSHG